MKPLIINEYEKNNKDFNSAVDQIMDFIDILSQKHISGKSISDDKELISDVKESIDLIKSVLNDESINSMSYRDFLKTWVSEFMVY